MADTAPQDGSSLRTRSIAIFLGGVLLLFSSLPALGSSIGEVNRYRGESVYHGGSDYGGGAVDCSGVATVPQQYLPWVKQASDTWLSGDQAALIALVQVESAWHADAHNSSSSASGLGQFTTGTAMGMREFVGGDDTTGRVWPPGEVTPARGPNDARYDPERAIFATSHLLHGQLGRYGNNLREAYERGYHTYNNPEQERAAKAAGERLMKIYDDLKASGGCQVTGGTTGGTVPASEIGEKIASTAERYIGYTTSIDQSTGENTFKCNAPTRSCASFVSTVLKESGAWDQFIGNTTDLWKNSGGTVVVAPYGSLDLSKLQRGDVVWFGRGQPPRYPGMMFNHVGIYVGNGLIVDTSSSSRNVQKRSITTHRGSAAFSAAKRFGL